MPTDVVVEGGSRLVPGAVGQITPVLTILWCLAAVAAVLATGALFDLTRWVRAWRGRRRTPVGRPAPPSPAVGSAVRTVVVAALLLLVATGATIERLHVSQDELDRAVRSAILPLEAAHVDLDSELVADAVADRLDHEVRAVVVVPRAQETVSNDKGVTLFEVTPGHQDRGAAEERIVSDRTDHQVGLDDPGAADEEYGRDSATTVCLVVQDASTSQDTSDRVAIEAYEGRCDDEGSPARGAMTP